MPDYGLTPKGPNIKRLDAILDEMHSSLSEKLGVNTRQNPQSLLNHLLTNIADQIAELWELGLDIYYSQYPSSAEGISLDNAAQYGGSVRETAAKSYYPIHCTGVDGTRLSAGTLISSTTNPTTQLVISEAKEISRNAFNKVSIKIAYLGSDDVYTVAINGAVFSYSAYSVDVSTILHGLAKVITDNDFYVTVDEGREVLSIESKDLTSTNVLILSDNLTTETVTTILTFGTVETGDILLPEGVITNIVKSDAGLLGVVNICGYIAGREKETDTEFRQSYIDKIFNRSSRMLESIRSAILMNCQGVESVAPYENPSHEWDEFGRPPHSIEIVVDGGDSREIAQQILERKAGGINTFGDTTIVLSGAYDEDIPVSFSRPTTIYTWFHIGITLSKTEAVPPNYADLLREVVLENMDRLNAGEDVIPQRFMSQLYRACSGISYVDICIYTTSDASVSPDGYPYRSAVITARQRAHTSKDMIEVEING